MTRGHAVPGRLAAAGRLARQASLDKGFEGVDFARPGDPSSHAVMQQVHDGGRDM